MLDAKKIAIVILAHDDRPALENMVSNVRFFCPNATIVLYNSGDDPSLGEDLDLVVIPYSRRLYYARIIYFFVDLFDWLAGESYPYDYIVNLDSDVLFIRPGFERFISSSMEGYDYMAPRFRLFTSRQSRWRPLRSLRPELPEWYQVFGFQYTHEAFNPGQTFSREYIQRLLGHEKYPCILELIQKNLSFTLHEVLFPTLVDLLQVKARSYPTELDTTIRYRPYQAVRSVQRALQMRDAYFVHPVRRELDNPTRVFIQSLIKSDR